MIAENTSTKYSRNVIMNEIKCDFSSSYIYLILGLHSTIPGEELKTFKMLGSFEEYYDVYGKEVNINLNINHTERIIYAPDFTEFMEWDFDNKDDKETAFNSIWPFEGGLPGMDEMFLDLHSGECQFVSECKIISYKGIPFIVCRDFENTGGSVFDMVFDEN